MSDEIKIMVIGAYLWGALYAAGVFVAALAWQSHVAAILIIASAGFAYLCQMVGGIGQMTCSSRLAGISGLCMVGSIIAGLSAGVCLLAGL